ncbi:MAG: diguanylate cyclase, partial [Hyphomicrobiales bacterium]
DAAGSESGISEVLRGQGFISVESSLDAGTAACTGVDRPDIVVLDLLNRRETESTERFVAFARTLKHDQTLSSLPVIAVGDEASCSAQASEDIRNAPVDDLIVGPVNSRQICGRVTALVRLSTMHEELVRRLNTSAKYGVDAPPIAAPPKQVADATVLVIGATESFPVIEQCLSPHAALVGALSPSTALDYMARRQFDTVIVDLDGDPKPYLEFCDVVRRNSRMYNIPIVLLAPAETVRDPAVEASDGVTDVMAKPVRPRELETRIVSLIKEMRFRDSLRSVYKEARHMATSDGLTGLYSRGFLLEHLRAMIKDARARADVFSLAFLEIANIAQINKEFGYVVGDRIIRQVGEIMGYLVRGEDLTARYSGARFCIILPDTTLEAAQIALKRIAGVVKHTALTAPDIERPITADLICSVGEIENDSGPEAMIERMRAKLG